MSAAWCLKSARRESSNRTQIYGAAFQKAFLSVRLVSNFIHCSALWSVCTVNHNPSIYSANEKTAHATARYSMRVVLCEFAVLFTNSGQYPRALVLL